jgi:hypothetical protein
MYERIGERKRGRGKADYLRKPFELVIVPGERERASELYMELNKSPLYTKQRSHEHQTISNSSNRRIKEEEGNNTTKCATYYYFSSRTKELENQNRLQFVG